LEDIVGTLEGASTFLFSRGFGFQIWVTDLINPLFSLPDLMAGIWQDRALPPNLRLMSYLDTRLPLPSEIASWVSLKHSFLVQVAMDEHLMYTRVISDRGLELIGSHGFLEN
jgi:hypothetical protein